MECTQKQGSRDGFTLVEMLVAVAVLAIVLAIIGAVFEITVDACRQSAAYAEAQRNIQCFVRHVKEDLGRCEPSKSILVLHGRTQAAALTQADLEAGKFNRVLVGNQDDPACAAFDPEYSPGADPNTNQYSDPRADIMMFFSNRPVASQAVPPDYVPGPWPEGYDPMLADLAGERVKFSPIQVVYGHAAIGEAVLDGVVWHAPDPSSLHHIGRTITACGNELSEIPSSHWHLSRRQTMIASIEHPGILNRHDAYFSPESLVRVVECLPQYEDPTWHCNELAQKMPGDMAWLHLPYLLQMFSAGYSELSMPLLSPYRSYDPGLGGYPAEITDEVIPNLLYHPASPTKYRHVATVLPEVPLNLPGNLGVHLLPGCAWFQVEFLMPEDSRNSVGYADPQPFKDDGQSFSERFHWVSVEPGQTYVFVPDTTENRECVMRAPTYGDEIDQHSRLATFSRLDQDPAQHLRASDAVRSRVVRMWPYAIRLTVHVYDDRGALKQPVMRSIVHFF